MGCCAGVNRNINHLNDILIIENKGEFLKIKEPNTDIQGTQKTGKEEIKKKKLSNKSQNDQRNDNKDIQKTDNNQDVQKNDKEGQKREGNVKLRPSSKTANKDLENNLKVNKNKIIKKGSQRVQLAMKELKLLSLEEINNNKKYFG